MRRGVGRARCGLYEYGKGQKGLSQHAPPDMLTGQSSQACLRREVPADREAHSHRFGGSRPRRPKRNAKARSHPCSALRRERTGDGWRRERNEPEQPSSGITDLHVQCLEGEESSSEWGWGLPDHAQHVRERAERST